MQVPLSAVILTYNEEGSLPACLDSLAGWAGEIIVVDSGSTDRTLEIAKRYTSRIYTHPFENYAQQRNWAQKQLPLQYDWVFHVDAGEQVSTGLAEQLTEFFAHGPPEDVNGLLVIRRTIFLGRWIRHGGQYPVYHLRVFRRHKGHCEERLHDQHFVVNGKVHVLRGDLIDTITDNLDSWTFRHIRWAGLESQSLMSCPAKESLGEVQGRLNGTPIERRRWLRNVVYYRMPLFIRPFGFFLYHYLFRLGFLDGREGLIFWVLRGFWYRFYLDAKIYEAGKTTRLTQPQWGAQEKPSAE